ncbi:MAG: histidinol-phosphatase HisJ family protein [Bacillota bacterium]|nr:histidinol-phosphatase HisJ family protein [Bacillota bacterium]
MVFSDYHVHTAFSPDSQASMEDMVLKGIELGLTEMAFTDHVDIDSPGDDFITMDSYNHYYPVFKALQAKYAERITLILGIENGYQPQVTKKMEAILNEVPFDFALMSVHTVDHKRCHDPEYQEGVTEATATIRYLETILQAVTEFRNYDSLAHLTFLARYLKSKSLSYSGYKEYFNEIFSLLIAGGKALEVNTSGYRYGLSAPIPDWELLKSYYKAGGRFITMGSDAHITTDLARDFDIVQQGLAAIGFKTISTFRCREMILQPLIGQPRKTAAGLSRRISG